MQHNFDKHAVKASEFLHKVANNLGDKDDLVKAERITKAVLHALRNRLSVEESFQFMAQLPLIIKGIYVDGWKFSKEFVRIKHLEEFIEEVYREAGKTASVDFETESSALKSISCVFSAIKNQVSKGEIDHIKAVFPKELKQLWDEPILSV